MMGEAARASDSSMLQRPCVVWTNPQPVPPAESKSRVSVGINSISISISTASAPNCHVFTAAVSRCIRKKAPCPEVHQPRPFLLPRVKCLSGDDETTTLLDCCTQRPAAAKFQHVRCTPKTTAVQSRRGAFLSPNQARFNATMLFYSTAAEGAGPSDTG